jgi:hypothetical protein
LRAELRAWRDPKSVFTLWNHIIVALAVGGQDNSGFLGCSVPNIGFLFVYAPLF